MSPKLRIAAQLELPLDVVTQTLAAIGRKGAGKTYLATMLAEQMLDAGAQVVAVDPVGVWWGLRVGADGRSPGKDVFVIGGDHGDVPLVPEAGARIARLVVEKNISAVLDVSGFRLGERKRFATDFGEELLHLKKRQRSPVHLFVEEAQLFIPQRVGPDEARMVGAFEQLVRLGRNYGLGATLVTQRPQSVNKEVLSQVECLCVLQVTGPHERKALEEWVQEVGGERKLVGELPGLGRGEGYVWSPAWLRLYQRVRFSKKATFDASATPEVGKAARAATLSSVDVEALRRDLSEVVAAAEQDDPKALRRRIAELQRELAAKPTAGPERVEVPVVTPVPILTAEQQQWLRDTVQVLDNFATSGPAVLARARAVADEIKAALHAAVRDPLKVVRAVPGAPGRGVVGVGPGPRSSAPAAPAVRRGRATEAGGGSIASGERKILTALAHYPAGRTKVQVAILTGYAHNGGGFNNYLSSLRARGFVEGSGDALLITGAGLEALGAYLPLPSGHELLEHWRRQLGKAERAALDVLVEAYPNGLEKATLAEAAGYEANGGGFNNALSRLRTLELIERHGGWLKASDNLFGGRS